MRLSWDENEGGCKGLGQGNSSRQEEKCRGMIRDWRRQGWGFGALPSTAMPGALWQRRRVSTSCRPRVIRVSPAGPPTWAHIASQAPVLHRAALAAGFNCACAGCLLARASYCPTPSPCLDNPSPSCGPALSVLLPLSGSANWLRRRALRRC